MFGENKKEDTVKKGKVETIMGNGTKIDGDIRTNGSLRVEGEVQGNVKAEGDLFVGESGKVKSEIEAREVVIAGVVEGNVVAHKKLEILPKGKLLGDIKTDKLKIEEGATFIGSSQTLKKSAGDKKSVKRKTTDSKKNKKKRNN
ncbi:MAG: bactofilin family protein [Halanaerobiales bacterium]